MANEIQDDNDSDAGLSADSEKSDLLSIAKKRFNLAVEAESESRKEQLDDLRFRAGEQWPSDIKNARELDRRPCLTINRLPQFVRQITNDQRQNRPSIKVNPVDDEATVETAKVLQGIIRHIEYNSNADIAYDTAFEGACNKGLGYFRIVTDYADSNSFDQEIFIRRIRNSFKVYVDPNYQEPDGSDMNWAFVFEDISKDDYKAQYPGSNLSDMQDWVSLGDNADDWVKRDACRIAEYFFKTFKKVKIFLMSDGSIIEESQMPEQLPQGITVAKEREAIQPAIKWAKINGVEILDETDWLGQWIPIVPVQGDEIDLDGKRIFEGVIRHAKDPQRQYNYWSSSATETIALAPRAPWIGVEGQFEGHEDKWQTANTKNHAFLEVRPVAIGGQPAPLPTRNTFEPPTQAISSAMAQSVDDFKATTGIYDATLGNRSNEQSGIAIQRRNTQAQTSNYHYIDNLSRALRHGGRIILDLIPKIYDTAKVVRMIAEDGSVDMVAINQIFQEHGQNKEHDLSVGKYDVTISTGPSYQTKRQEAVASMMDFIRFYPQGAQVVGDLMVRNMDWPGAQEIADRLKKMLPPGIAEDGKDKQNPIPPQAQAQMAQMGQMIQQLSQSLQETTQEIKMKKFEIESKERIEFAKMKTDLAIELAKHETNANRAILDHQVGLAEKLIDHRLDQLSINQNLMAESSGGNTAAGPGQGSPQQQPTGGQSPGSPMGV